MDIQNLKEKMVAGEIKELPAVTFPGGYPLIYFTANEDILCAKCANNRIDEIEAYDIYWEGTPIQCSDCSEDIDSAYGDVQE